MIIGLNGKKFHGKDTVADIIKNIKSDVVCLSFAEPIKKALSIIHEIPEEYFNDPDKKEIVLEKWNKSPRQLMQWLGTDVYRKQFDQDIWLKNMELRINKYKNGITIVTDIRFDNEAELVKRLGGKIWKIDASKRIKKTFDNHMSEQGIDPIFIDEIIDNNNSLKDLNKLIFHKFYKNY